MADYLKKLRDGEGGKDSTKKERGKGFEYSYKPKKEDRKMRSHIWDRFLRMRDDSIRKEVEADWEQADKKMRMWRPEKDPDDWRADIRLPDSFAAVQTHLQETIGIKIRPSLKPQEGSDTPLAWWANGIMTYNMDRTDFDLEVIKAMHCNAARGTAFTVEEYLYETRTVKDPVSVANGVLQYKKKEIVDKDDTYTKFYPNERVFIDEAAEDIESAEDMIIEERMRIDTFKTKYGNADVYVNVDKVIPKGSMSERTNYFDNAMDDMDGDYVQVLRYTNKMTDTYAILANTVIITKPGNPIPYKHKELNVAVWNYYPVEGRIYGIGLPKLLSPLQEEREAIRNLSVDRQKMHLNKMFLVSDLFDIDEDEATTRPHGFISVASGGMSLDNAIKPLEYGDVPGSSIKMDDQIREDETRVSGIDDRSQSVNVGGTATEAAILTEQSQKRINLINTLTGMKTITRIGRLKWSNIRFFYTAPKVEMLTVDNKEREKKTYRKIGVDGKDFEIVEGKDGKKELKMNDVTGTGSFSLDPAYANFLEGDYDVRIQWDIKAVMPQAIRQSKIMEVFNGALANPFVMKETNIRRAYKDVLMEFDLDPKTWMTDGGKDDDTQMAKAQWENQVMLKGGPLDPTTNASEMHTMVHLWFVESDVFTKAVENNPALKDIFNRHIMGEVQEQQGPGGATSPAAGMQGTPGAEAMGGAPAEAGGAPAQPSPGAQNAAPPSAPPATPVVNGGEVTNQMAPMR